MNNNLKIVQISAAYSGAQKQIEDAIYTELARQGIESKVLYWIGESKNKDYIKCETVIEQFFRRLFYKFINKSYSYSWIQTKRAISIIKSINPDVVHLHSIHHGFVHFPMLFEFLRKENIRIIYSIHDMWPFTGGCYHYTSFGCLGYRNGCLKCQNDPKNLDCRKKDTAFLLDTKLNCYKNQDIIFVAVSDWVYEEFNKSSLKDYPCSIVLNSVNYTHPEYEIIPDSTILNEINNYKTILFVAASWQIGKGFDFICSLSDVLGDNYRFILVGNASGELRKTATSRMLFTGYINHKDLWFYYRNCNLYASASTEETFGMTFVEAAFEGTKSIGFNCTGIKNTLNSVNGVCVNSFDVNEFAKAIKEHVDDSKLTNEEINIIKKRFSPKRMADEYIKLYFK